MSSGRHALRLAVTFLLGSATSKILVFALLPLYTRVLDPEEYGYYDLSVTVVTIAASIIFLDIWVGTMRRMYGDTESERGVSVKAGLIILSASVVLFLTLGLIVGTVLEIPYLGLILGYGVSANIKEFFGFVARGYGLNATYSASGAIATVVMVGLNIVLLVIAKADLGALFVAAIVGNVVQIVWLEVRAKVVPTLWRYPSDWPRMRGLLTFCLPLGVNSVAYWLLTGVGKLVVFDRLTLADNGYYGIGTRLATLVVVLASVFTMVWQDISFTRGDANARVFYGRAMSFYLGFVGFGCAVLILGLGIAFPILVGEEFSPVFGLLPGFILVAGLGAYSTFLGNTFYALNSTAPVLVTTLVGATITVALSVPFVEQWGIGGANGAAAAGFGVIVVARLIVLNRRISTTLPVASTVVVAAVSAVATVVYASNIPWLSAATIVGVCLAFLVTYRRDLRQMFRRAPQTA